MKTIIYELNEVPKRLFDFYAAAFPKSAFSKLKQRAKLYETLTADSGPLSPWITWPTMHRGVSNSEHCISDIGQDLTHVNKQYPPIWDLLARAGRTVGVFGCLQSYPLPQTTENYAFYVPDTFAANDECFPDVLTRFQTFNLSMVRSNGRNVSVSISRRDVAKFLIGARKMGLTWRTAAKLAHQLIAERVDDTKVVRRRTSQIEIAFDLYQKQLHRSLPDISFFFTNHLASSMHRYWPTVFPNDYPEGKFDSAWQKKWCEEIPHAVRVANWQLDKLVRFCDDKKHRLIVASSMGQNAVADTTPVFQELFIRDIRSLFRYLHIADDTWEPRLGMAPLVVVRPLVENFEAKLEALDRIAINGHPIKYTVTSTGEIRFDFCLSNATEVFATDRGVSIDPAILGVQNVSLQDAAGAYAYHIPEGLLIDYMPDVTCDNSEDTPWRQFSVLDFAPSLLQMFDADVPAHMKGDERWLS
jgi:hypothetical protein